jgi:hypothetical protein
MFLFRWLMQLLTRKRTANAIAEASYNNSEKAEPLPLAPEHDPWRK